MSQQPESESDRTGKPESAAATPESAPPPPPRSDSTSVASALAGLHPKTRLEQGLSVVTLGFLLIGCFVVMVAFLFAIGRAHG